MCWCNVCSQAYCTFFFFALYSQIHWNISSRMVDVLDAISIQQQSAEVLRFHTVSSSWFLSVHRTSECTYVTESHIQSTHTHTHISFQTFKHAYVDPLFCILFFLREHTHPARGGAHHWQSRYAVLTALATKQSRIQLLATALIPLIQLWRSELK